jgi:hypothetical protein
LYNGTAGSKFLEYNPGSELNPFSLNNEQWKAKESNETKIPTKDEQKVGQQTK